MFWDPTKDTTANLQAFVARLYTSQMERTLQQAAREELTRRDGVAKRIQSLNGRRFALINAEIVRELSPVESQELDRLNAEVDVLVDSVAPLPE